MKKLPCKTIVWQKFWGKQPSVIRGWWFLIVHFYQCARTAESLCLAQLCKVCKATQAAPALLAELWALWKGTVTPTQPQLWSLGLQWPRQHCHCTSGSIFWPTLVSKLGFTNSLLSQLSQAFLPHCKLFPPLQRLICSVPVWSVNHQLWGNSTCSDVSIYSLWFHDRTGGEEVLTSGCFTVVCWNFPCGSSSTLQARPERDCPFFIKTGFNPGGLEDSN